MKITKNKLFILIAVAALITSSEPANIKASQSGGAESTVNIEFEEGNAEVEPLDPDKPEIPDSGGSGESGSLALNYVSNFYFDKEEILMQKAEYPTTTRRPYIQITDARGSGEGWSVTARASKFKTTAGKESLFGASMTLRDSSCISPTPQLPMPQPKSEVTLMFDGSDLAEVASAGEGTGMGTWLIRWYTNPGSATNPSVILNVPSSSAMAGENTATITWILGSGPT